MKPRSASILLSFLCFSLFWSGCSSQRSGSAQSNEQNNDLKFRLGSFDDVTKTDYVRATIQVVEGRSFQLSSGGSDSGTRNFLFLNVKTQESRLLLPIRDYLIFSSWELRPGTRANGGIRDEYGTFRYGTIETKDSQPQAPTQWLLYLVIKADTNQKNGLDADDLKTVAISDYSGSNYAEVLSGITSLHYSTVTDANTLVAVYEKDGKDLSSVIDLPSRKITETKDLINWRNGQ